MDNRSLLLVTFWTAVCFILLSLFSIGVYFFGKIFIKFRTEVEESSYRKYKTELDIEADKVHQEPLHNPPPTNRSDSIFSLSRTTS